MGLQIRRGYESERLTITPAEGEPIWIIDTDKLWIGDGTTVGGNLASPEQLVGVNDSPEFYNITISNQATVGILLFASDTSTVITSRAELIGPTGYTGSLGNTGFTGSAGTTGFTGSQGNLGYTGSLGFTGSAGTNGYTGSQGDIGFTGSSGAGFTGSQGNIGYTGSSGSFDQTLNTTSNVIFNSVVTQDVVSAGGYPLDANGQALIITNNTQTPAMIVSNYTSGILPQFHLRGYGQNRPGTVTTATGGNGGITMENWRGTPSAPLATGSGDSMGGIFFHGYTGSKSTLDYDLSPAGMFALAAEQIRGNATTATNAGARFVFRTQAPAIEMNATSRNFPILQSWTAGSTTLAPAQNFVFGNGDQTTPTLIWSGATGAGTTSTHIGHGQTNVNWINTNQFYHGVPSQQLFTFTGEISGTTMTVTTLTSGNILSLNSRIYSGANQYGFISAFGTATGGTGTYVLTTSSTVTSGTLSHGPDNPGLSETNYLMLISSRRSGASGRRNSLKTGDSVGQIYFRGQSSDSATGTGATAARIATNALEDFSGSARGTKMQLQTVSSGTTTASPRLDLSDRENIYRSDLHTFYKADGSTTVATFTTSTTTFRSDSLSINKGDNTQQIALFSDQNIVLGRSGANALATFNTTTVTLSPGGTTVGTFNTNTIILTGSSAINLQSSQIQAGNGVNVPRLQGQVGMYLSAAGTGVGAEIDLGLGGSTAIYSNGFTAASISTSSIYLQSTQILAGDGVDAPRIQGRVGLRVSAANGNQGGEIEMNLSGGTTIISSGTVVASFNTSTTALQSTNIEMQRLNGAGNYAIFRDGANEFYTPSNKFGNTTSTARVMSNGSQTLRLTTDTENSYIDVNTTTNIDVKGHVIPSANDTYDLGSTSTRWRSLYVSTATIYLGDNALSVSGGSLTLNGSAQVGYTGSQGNIGYTGSQGNIGYTGSQGNIGYTGSKGDIGYTGSQGPGITLSTASGTQSLTTSSGLLASITDNAGKLAYYNTTLGDWRYIDGDTDVFAPTYNIDYLVVAGGGASDQGGGGAGGYNTGTVSVTGGTSYTITVGAGGAAGVGGTANGGNGNNSIINTISTSTGGGGGAWSTNTPGSGGSGGGAGQTGGGTYAGGTGTAGQGNNGGSNGGFNAPNYPGGGGGGAGAVGGNATNGSTAGVGGAGKTWFDGTTYAGGGGGGNNVTSGGGAGGAGGGGQGGYGGALGGVTAGTVNTGGGGGGDGGTGFGGGSGIVIIRYSGGTVGSGGTITSAGGFTYHTFTASGTFTS